MRRADRLFKIVQLLRGRRLTTAQQLSTWLNVSERTIYRDMRELSVAGMWVEGEAGVGYRLRGEAALPPLMFELNEIEALALGARMVQAWSAPSHASAAVSALAKIAAALPRDRQEWVERTRAFVPQYQIPAQLGEHLHVAIRERRMVSFVYRAEEASNWQQACVRPLALYFWGERWTLAAWSEDAHAFASFALERMLRLRPLDACFADEAGKRLADYKRALEPSPRAIRKVRR
jgi:predicted DNA-binding transcriptional regulator YafY